MSKPEIVIERKIVVGQYGYIVRESGGSPESTELVYRDNHNGPDVDTLSIADLADLDAIIECLQARRVEIKDRLDADKAKKDSSNWR